MEKSYNHDMEYKDYSYIISLLQNGSINDWEELSLLVDNFPFGADDFVGRHWITNAVDCGSLLCIKWMVGKGVNLNFRNEEGYCILHSCLDRNCADKYEILQLLINNEANVNALGINTWTPLHMAAVRNDMPALELLLKNGADRTIRTTIDNYSTPAEEAKLLGSLQAYDYLMKLD